MNHRCPLYVGALVRTAPRPENDRQYVLEAIAQRKAGLGVVLNPDHDTHGHGRCVKVLHLWGVAYYEPEEVSR